LVVFGALPSSTLRSLRQITTFLRFALAFGRLAVFVHLLIDEACTFLDFALHAHVGLLFDVRHGHPCPEDEMRQGLFHSTQNNDQCPLLQTQKHHHWARASVQQKVKVVISLYPPGLKIQRLVTLRNVRQTQKSTTITLFLYLLSKMAIVVSSLYLLRHGLVEHLLRGTISWHRN
jgi:hypothetical protein